MKQKEYGWGLVRHVDYKAMGDGGDKRDPNHKM